VTDLSASPGGASRILRAKWILPIDRPPLADGWIEIAAGRIRRLGSHAAPGPAEDLGRVAILPGLVNAHTHLELSWMAGRVPPADSMDDWIRGIVRLRRAGGPGAEIERQAALDAARAMRATGTALVGDISNALTTPAVIREAGLDGVVFHELIGFSTPDPERVVRDAWARARAAEPLLAGAGRPTPPRVGVVAHAPYSVSPELFREIARVARGGAPLAVHLGESPEEIEFLRTGRGPIRATLESLGVWSPAWSVPGCDPVRYMAELGYLQPAMLAVHAVHVTDDGLERLRDAGAYVVSCPRSNLWVGVGPPRLSHFYAADVPVAFGTDSLASSPSLNMFDELAEARRLAPDVEAGCLLESATRVGAAALGFGDTHGTLAPGRAASFVVVDLPAGVTDVEEYLVTGVPPASVRPLERHPAA
jgi:cytosine/adenosine deaminase-related metal-dependent hydrolase